MWKILSLSFCNRRINTQASSELGGSEGRRQQSRAPSAARWQGPGFRLGNAAAKSVPALLPARLISLVAFFDHDKWPTHSISLAT